MEEELLQNMSDIIIETIQKTFDEAIDANDYETVRVFLNTHRRNGTLYIDRALCLCAQKNYIELMKLILNASPGPDIKYTDIEGRRALHYCAFNGSLEGVKVLIRKGSAVNWSDMDGFNPLHWACHNDHYDVAEYLIARGAHMTSARSYKTGETPLHVAAGVGNLRILDLLIKSGIDINVKTTIGKGGYTALHKAAEHAKSEAVKFLCENGAKVNIFDCVDKSPLHMAADTGDVESVIILVENGADPLAEDYKDKTPLMFSVNSENSESTRYLVHCCPESLDIPDHDGYFPIHRAVLAKDETLVMDLIEAGANVNVCGGNKKHTALHMACSAGNASVVNSLLMNGAMVNVQDDYGTTPLHRAQTLIRSQEYKEEIIYSLLQAGACINTVDNQGFSPLLRCVCASSFLKCSTLAFKMLIQHGATLKAQTNSVTTSRTPRSLLVWLAWHSNNLELADYLVRAGWDLTNETWVYLHGKTPAHEEFHERMRQLLRYPRNLQHTCRMYIRDHLSQLTQGREIMSRIQKLPMPPKLINYLSLVDE